VDPLRVEHALVRCALAAALVASACGGDESASAGPSGTTSSSGVTSSTTSSGPGSGGSGGGPTTGTGGDSSSSSASSGGAATGGGSSSIGSGGGPSDVAQTCVDTINSFRSSIGAPALERWTEAEECTDGEAQADAESGMPHTIYPACGEIVQNVCVGWPGTPERMIVPCLQMMWDEGPGRDFNTHGDYINMSGVQFTKVACGFYPTATGTVWATQNFQ
jgi:hypothetical protein